MNKLAKALSEAIQTLVKCVVPLYSDHRGAPAIAGSGFFVRHGSLDFLVSAAHVLDIFKKEQGYYYVTPSTTRKLSGRLITNAHVGRSRKDDLLDVGAILLEGPALPPYPAVAKFPIDSSLLLANHQVTSTSRYGFVGFPESRSSVRRSPRQISVEAHAYIGNSIPPDEYRKSRLDPSSHICLAFDNKRSFDLEGQPKKFPKPHGISGAPIFHLYDEENLTDEGAFTIAGVITTWRPQARRVFGSNSLALAELLDAF